ncbi:hypothetical protein [Hydrogenophaga sp. PAMC20947]|uniref:hypothetical protein n=1 Tax=Hydrogenophaga sp. PAMC20947 TaxID=2565558 RepID=UPI00109DD9AB|nr:hypothetical protein [Hydrogenophaga sp. PAMC20947]QCB47426.1 hypothetical protein E5678_16185 [Hydrogenophaga sp. PAMC20947]
MIRLSQSASDSVALEQVTSGEMVTAAWLQERQALGTFSNRRIWNSGNSSTRRLNLIKVNGFDETLGYRAEDVGLGFRINNAGMRRRHLRCTNPALHL